MALAAQASRCGHWQRPLCSAGGVRQARRHLAGKSSEKSQDYAGGKDPDHIHISGWSHRSNREAQQRLYDATARAMHLHYCRESGDSKVWQWLRGITIDTNYDFRRWKKHQRATRHLSLWTPKNVIFSDNCRRLLVPDMLVVLGASIGVCLWNTFFHGGHALLQLPIECFSVTSVTLGLLTTFKTQTCYNRFDDGRQQWGLMINETRGFASRVLNRVPSKGFSTFPHSGVGDEPRVLRARLHAAKLIQTFGHTLKYHLTEDGCNPQIQIWQDTTQAEINSKTAAALQAELELLWDMEDEGEAAVVKKLMAPDAGNRPMMVLHELSHINARIFSDPMRGGLNPIISTDIDRSITVLHHVLGRCERILRTPIYTPYTKFTSRFLYMWCSTLPLAMYPILGPWVTPPVSVVVSFFLLGIQDIGSRVEQPFDVLPLWQYCQTIDQSVDQMLRQTESLRRLRGSRDGYHNDFR